MDQAVYVRDLGRRLIYINPAAERLTGWSLEEALKRPCYKIFGDAGEQCNHNCPVDRAMGRVEALSHTEGTVINRAGEAVEVRVSISPMKEDGALVGSVVLLDDLQRLRDADRTHVKALMRAEVAEATARERLEEVERLKGEAETSHKRLAEAIESLHEGFALFDSEDRLVLFNSRYKAIAGPVSDLIAPGVSFEALLRAGLEAGAIYDSEGEQDPEAIFEARMQGHRAPNSEWQVGHQDGRWLQVLERRTPDGETAVVQTDITAFKQRSAELQAALDRLETIGGNSPGVLFEMTGTAAGDLRFTYLSVNAGSLLGRPVEEILAEDNVLEKLVSPADRDDVLAAVAESEKTGSDIDLEFRIDTFDGRELWVHAKASPRRDARAVTVWDGYVWDVTASRAVMEELEHKRAELEQKNLLLETTFGTMAEGIAVYGPDHGLITWNQAFLELFEFPDDLIKVGVKLEELLKFCVDRGDFGDTRFENVPEIARILRVSDVPQVLERPGPGGKTIELTITPMPAGGMVTTFADITERKTAELALLDEREKLANFITHMPAAVVMMDRDQNFLAVSDRWLDYFQAFEASREEMIGQNYFDIYPDAPDEYRTAFKNVLKGAVEAKERERLRWPSGHEEWVRWEIRPWRLADRTIGGITIFVEIITAQVEAEEQIRFHASYDALTGLPNRRLFNDRLKQLVAQAERDRARLAVLLIDLDGFKLVNDSFGHGAGDALLVEIGNRLKSHTRTGDTVARLGGDEFTVILNHIGHGEDAGRVGEKILEAINAPVVHEDNELKVSGSIGVALYPEDGADADQLVRNADAAMYHAKNSGKNMVTYYRDDFNQKVQKRLTIESELRRAIDRNELTLHYQPRIDTRDQRCVGVEALVRWQHPERGMIPPGDFIPVAEESGLIVPLGEWVMNEACQAAQRWQQAGCDPIRIAVNVSSKQFRRGNLLGLVESTLDKTGLPADRLEVEITEGTLMEEPEQAAALLARIRALGTHVAVDDFGVGYSCLSYLKRLPIDILKIDASFVRDVTTDPEDAAIVSTIIDLADNLHLGVIAEGVETVEHAQFLTGRGCKEAQGFLYSKPLAEGDLLDFLKHIEAWKPDSDG